jgi:hypothetical protein
MAQSLFAKALIVCTKPNEIGDRDDPNGAHETAQDADGLVLTRTLWLAVSDPEWRKQRQ